MKLLTKYNRVTLATTIIVMVITGFIYYHAISRILTNQIDKDLVVEEHEIFDYVKLNHHLPQVFDSNDQQISFYAVPQGSVKREFINTWYCNGKERRRKHESGRGIISSVMVDGKYYKILVVESKVEMEGLIRFIFVITAGLILFVLLVLLVTDRVLLNRLWKPFYAIMKELRVFNITDATDPQKVNTDIDEFSELSVAVVSMASRVKNDYKDLKTFTENASHELLTPIAVINSKLDTLVQTGDFSERQSKLLNDLYMAVNRLNRLNQSLLLLVKIENKVDSGKEKIDMRPLLEELITQFEEIFLEKELNVSSTLNQAEVYANRYLLEISLNNLLSNAIRHNYKGGEIAIALTQESLVIRNTGGEDPLPQEKIFNRFQKSSGSEGTGLGLTISRQICGNFNFLLSYRFDHPYHIFTVNF